MFKGESDVLKWVFDVSGLSFLFISLSLEG